MQLQTIDDKIKYFLDKKFRYSRSFPTMDAYRTALNKFQEFLKVENNLDINQMLIQFENKTLDPIEILDRFYSFLSNYNKKGYANRTICLYVIAVKEFLNSQNLHIYNEDIKQKFRLPKRSPVYEEGLTKKYEEVFGEKGKFSEIIQQNFGENGKIIKDLFDPNKEGTPLYNLGNTLRNEISQLRQQIGIKGKEDELVQKTPLKGTPFEKLCEDLIGEVARHYGDSLENTTKKIGRLTDSKKGDFVLTLAGTDKKIVFDMKAQSSPISVNDIQETLKKSIENRDAFYGILIVKTVESLPKAVGWFQEYENNKLVCALSTKEREDTLHYELLLIACKWARKRVMLQTLQEAKVNAELIRNKIERIQRKLSELSLIKSE